MAGVQHDPASEGPQAYSWAAIWRRMAGDCAVRCGCYRNCGMAMHDLITPNRPSSASAEIALGAGWLGLMFFAWYAAGAAYLPTPVDVARAIPKLFIDEGLGQELWKSFMLNLEALALMAALSLLLAYATVLPPFRPLAALISTGRFNGFVGMPLIFLSILHNPHRVKLALLVFGAGVFTVLSLVKMIEDIPKEAFDHSRTLRMSEWRVVWEVVVLGRIDEVFDILRINGAMLWLMLPMVEGRFKFEGGVGALMEVQDKHLNLDMVMGALFVILAVGLLLDMFYLLLKRIVCPYAALGMERQ